MEPLSPSEPKHHTPNFKEEQSAKIPALTLLTNLGYQFIPPSECMVMRGNKTTVILPQVLRKVLSFKTYPFMGKKTSFIAGCD